MSIKSKYNIAMFFIFLAMLTVETVHGEFPYICVVSLAISGMFIFSAKLDEERMARKRRRRKEITQMRHTHKNVA